MPIRIVMGFLRNNKAPITVQKFSTIILEEKEKPSMRRRIILDLATHFATIMIKERKIIWEKGTASKEAITLTIQVLNRVQIHQKEAKNPII